MSGVIEQGELNQLVTSLQPMDDDLRSAYLQAMGIDCWVPKAELEQILPTNGNPSIASAYSTLETEVKTDADMELKKKLSVSAQPSEITEKSTPHVAQSAAKYLKMVNWSNQIVKQENAKQLLIICRHQIEQPANSFARTHSPSQFMLDYINALLGLLTGQSFELNIRLAHLSEAGLGENAIAMQDVLQKELPDLVLVLGDETVSHLLGNQTTVASLRGQLINLQSPCSALVSYHPFSLIENPSLKSLAFDDLSMVAEYLINDVE